MLFRRFFKAAPAFLLVLLSGCSLLQQIKPSPEETTEAPQPVVTPEVEPLTGEWPVDAPPRELFIQDYEADGTNKQLQSLENYLGWVARFYEGRRFQPGWLGISEQVLEQTPDDLETQVRFRLQALGRNIGGEWAKANRVRLINTRMVAVWHEAFSESMKQEEALDFLTRLEDDVAALINGDLSPEAIAYERYYEEDFFF